MSFSSNDYVARRFRGCAPTIIFFLLGAWAADACGGVSEHSPSAGSGDASSSSGGGSGSSSGGASGSSSGGGTTACPSSPPTAGTGCIAEGQWCQYGDDPDVACDTVVYCQGARWTQTPTAAGICPTLAPGTSDCPATTPPATGEVCFSSHVCAYPTGLCGCGPSDIVIELPDGGATDLSWLCESPGAGCPEPRPAIGSACSSEGLACMYGTCAVIDSVVGLTCVDGKWAGGGFSGCPD